MPLKKIFTAALLLAFSIIIASCSGPKKPVKKAKATSITDAKPIKKAKVPQEVRILKKEAITQKTAKLAKPMTPGYSDSLKTGSKRSDGEELNGKDLEEGKKAWTANKGILLTKDGTTAKAPGGAHHAIPKVSGTIEIAADVNARGSGFAGIALGRGNLSSNFWKNLSMVFYVKKNRYGLLAGKTSMIKKVKPNIVKVNGDNHLELKVDTVAQTVTAKINGTAVLDSVKLPSGTKAEKINVAGFRINEPLVSGKPLVKNYKATAISSATGGLEPLDYNMFFVDPNKKASLSWEVNSPGPNTQIPYEITDFTGKIVASGKSTITPDLTLTLSASFPRGYYDISFPKAKQKFGIVSLEAHQGPVDPFFCIDSALSWLETDNKKREALVKILARCGIAMSRERLSHGSVNPDKNKWNWEGGSRKYDTMRKIYQKKKVPVLEILGSGGKHMQMMKGSWYPRALAEAGMGWKGVAEHWKGNWGGVEPYNEPDLKQLPADQYSCLVKTASFAMKEAGVEAPLVTGVFASMPPGPYFSTFAENDALKDSNAVSLHSYDKASDIEGMFVRYRQWLKANGVERMPLWHTECGWSWRNGPARPPVKQDAVSALEITAKAIETKVCGASCHFPFVYVYYEEGKKNFGMMGREVTPLRSMAAYAVSISLLANKDYLGDVKGLNKSVKLARVFGNKNSNECLVMLYTGKVTPDANLNFPGNVIKTSGIDGRPLEAIGNKVPIPDGLTYVWTDLKSLGSNLKTDTTAARLYALGKNPLKQKRTASPLVLQFLFDKTPLRMNSSKYLLSHKVAKKLPITVRIHNLSNKAMKIVPTLQLPSSGKKAKLKASTIPALGFTDVSWQIDASASLDITSIKMIKITAASDTGIKSTTLAIPMIMSGTLEEHLKRHGSKKALPITRLNQWTKNNASHGKAKFSVDNKNFKMDISFSAPRNRWGYPIFNLKDKIDPTVDSGFLVRARIKNKAGTVALLANPNNPEGFWIRDIFPADGEWHVAYIPFEDMKPGPGHAGMQNTRLNPAKWNRIAVGMGSHAKDNSLEISHLLIVGKTKKAND